jgi:hypothetical protein
LGIDLLLSSKLISWTWSSSATTGIGALGVLEVGGM